MLQPNTKLVYGVGINDANYVVSGKRCEHRCLIYRTWELMMRRCYSASFQNRCPTYKNCAVCSKWHSFMNFRKWALKQTRDGSLDKDILSNFEGIIILTRVLLLHPSMVEYVVY